MNGLDICDYSEYQQEFTAAGKNGSVNSFIAL